MNKLAIVTGGSKGIGKALVSKFLSSGFDVITCARSQAGLDAMVDAISEEEGEKGHLTTVACDLSTAEGVDKLVVAYRLKKKVADVLINNTGVFVPGNILEEEDGVLEKTMDTNLYSAYHVTRAVAPDMMNKNGGHIFNLCSIASIMAYANGGSYSISKFALLGFSKVLREELKTSHVKVTAVLPGAVLTPSWEGVDLPEDRFIQADDIAESIYGAWQLSPGACVEELLIRPQLGDI